MAGSPEAGRLKYRQALSLLGLAALVCVPSAAQTRLSLEELESRNPARDFAPAHLDQLVTIRGIVNSTAFRFPGYTLLTIQDDRSGGVIRVDEADNALDSYRPGDDLEVDG